LYYVWDNKRRTVLQKANGIRCKMTPSGLGWRIGRIKLSDMSTSCMYDVYVQ
jgi:hypothetical protein